MNKRIALFFVIAVWSRCCDTGGCCNTGGSAPETKSDGRAGSCCLPVGSGRRRRVGSLTSTSLGTTLQQQTHVTTRWPTEMLLEYYGMGFSALAWFHLQFQVSTCCLRHSICSSRLGDLESLKVLISDA
jgi:hypothetical protein